MLSLRYFVKFRSFCLAIYNNEFILGSTCVGTEMIKRIATNTSNSYYLSKSHTCHITSFVLQHLLTMSFYSMITSSGHWLRLLTVHSVTADSERLTYCWCVISLCRRTILKSIQLMLNQLQIFNDFVVSVVFWADTCAIQYELIVVNGQTATSAFHKVV